jgi:hypothetical protein
MGPLLILLRGLTARRLPHGPRSARNRDLVPGKAFCQCVLQEYFSALTVGICQLPSREISGGSVGAMALLARSEARVMRGIVKEFLTVFS